MWKLESDSKASSECLFVVFLWIQTIFDGSWLNKKEEVEGNYLIKLIRTQSFVFIFVNLYVSRGRYKFRLNWRFACW